MLYKRNSKNRIIKRVQKDNRSRDMILKRMIITLSLMTIKMTSTFQNKEIMILSNRFKKNLKANQKGLKKSLNHRKILNQKKMNQNKTVFICRVWKNLVKMKNRPEDFPVPAVHNTLMKTE